MRNTIKAKIGYEVRHLKSKPDTVRVYDGDERNASDVRRLRR